MTAATQTAATTSRVPLLVGRLLMSLDATLVVWAVLAVRLALAHSTIFDGFAPHWQYERYVMLALLTGAAYVALSAAAGLYGPRAAARQQQVPLLVLGNLALLYTVITVVCARYTSLTFGRVLLAQRAVLFALVVVYVASTLAHYAHAAWRRRAGTATAPGDNNT
jgi:hypothetical protein